MKNISFASLLVLLASNVNAGAMVLLDVDAALRASEPAKAFSASLLQSTQSDEKAVKDLEQQARQLQADLEKSKGLLSTEDLQRKQMQFQKVYGEYQKQGQALQQLRAQKEQAFIQGIRPKLDEVIKQLIQERQISVILNRQSAIYTEPGVDITADVVKKLNELK
jgi:outer membrane protein